MLVAVSKVKAVGALPNDVGAQVYGLAALRAGPALRFFEQPLARAEAPLGFVHDQAVYLRARAAFQQMIRAYVHPADYAAVLCFGDINGVFRRRHNLPQPLPDLLGYPATSEQIRHLPPTLAHF